MDNEERWVPLPGYEGLYELSNKGRVKSLSREIDHGKGGDFRRQIAEKILKPSMNKGYEVVYLCRPGERNRHNKLYIEVALEKVFGITPKGDKIIDLPGEEWKPIKNYEGLYEISNMGRVKSVGWYVNGSSTNSYPKVELVKRKNIKTLLVHRLVAEAFVPNPLRLEAVHHIDEDKTNPRADNLEWTTRGENVQDWFDRRRVTISPQMLVSMAEELAKGGDAAEILARNRRKP